jgi:hypothetical protein
MHHVPCNEVSTCIPAVFEHRLIVFDFNVVFLQAQFAVKISCFGNEFGIFLKAVCSFFNQGKGLGMYFFQDLFYFFITVLFQNINLLIKSIFIGNLRKWQFFCLFCE